MNTNSIPRDVLVSQLRHMVEIIADEVEECGDSVEGEDNHRWELSRNAVVPADCDRSFSDYYNSDFADLADAFADYLEFNPEMSEHDAFHAAADEVEESWEFEDEEDTEVPAVKPDPQQALKTALVEFGHEIDISHEEARVYKFVTVAGIAEVTIDCPATIRVVDDHHFITDTTGVLEVVPPGWLTITIYPFGHEADDVEEAA